MQMGGTHLHVHYFSVECRGSVPRPVNIWAVSVKAEITWGVSFGEAPNNSFLEFFRGRKSKSVIFDFLHEQSLAWSFMASHPNAAPNLRFNQRFLGFWFKCSQDQQMACAVQLLRHAMHHDL
ncbi:hypothetical protein C8D83_101395 [Halothiobacillus neapolitanus]|nr:hypothetical protein C8D83_101395 [Halothiobacillus neapolitanus]